MTRLLLLPFLTLLLLYSCGSGDTAAAEAEQAAQEAIEAGQEQAYATMMEGHDRIMPLMGTITQLQRSVSEQMMTEGLAEERRELLMAANEQLEDANDGMMNWMGEVKTLDELRAEMNSEAITQYIKDQTAAVARVESGMTTSIASARELLGLDTGEHSHDHSHGDGGHDHDHEH